jgi:hypothetical protein
MPDLGYIDRLLTTQPVFHRSGRVIWRQGDADPLAAILAQVDISVLARFLVFDLDGAVLRLAVAGRRLRGVVAASDLPHAIRLPIGQVLEADDIDTARQIGAALAQLCRDRSQIAVQSVAAAPFGHPGQAGISATKLAALWSSAAEETPQQSPMARFLSANDTALHGVLVIRDQTIAARHGDTAAIETIWRDQFGAFRQRLAATQTTADRPLLVCLDQPAGQGYATAIAISGDEAAVLAYPSDQITPLLTSWRAITG